MPDVGKKDELSEKDLEKAAGGQPKTPQKF
jgi:hypothetical protein